MEGKSFLSSGNNITVPVSVVIPCYNCNDTIARAVASVSAQTRLPAEVIIVDDNSSTEAFQTLRNLANSYSEGWIKIIRSNINGGPGVARNIGWEASSQPFIAFLDADDAWHRQKIELQYEYMVHNADILFSGHRHNRIRHGERDDNSCVGSDLRAIPISKKAILLRNPFITPSVMIRRQVPYRFHKTKRFMEDHFLWMELICAGFRAACLDVPLANIYKAPIGESGLSSKLWSMEKGELDNYMELHRKGFLPLIGFFLYSLFSIAKYIRRFILVKTGWI